MSIVPDGDTLGRVHRTLDTLQTSSEDMQVWAVGTAAARLEVERSPLPWELTGFLGDGGFGSPDDPHSDAGQVEMLIQSLSPDIREREAFRTYVTLATERWVRTVEFGDYLRALRPLLLERGELPGREVVHALAPVRRRWHPWRRRIRLRLRLARARALRAIRRARVRLSRGVPDA